MKVDNTQKDKKNLVYNVLPKGKSYTNTQTCISCNQSRFCRNKSNKNYRCILTH
jgi:hypothetical protein